MYLQHNANGLASNFVSSTVFPAVTLVLGVPLPVLFPLHHLTNAAASSSSETVNSCAASLSVLLSDDSHLSPSAIARNGLWTVADGIAQK